MKLTKSLFTTSLLAAGMITAGIQSVETAQAAALPGLQTYVLGARRNTTTATFEGGATLNGGANYLKTVPANVPVDIMAKIKLDPRDVGLDGDLFLAIGVGPNLYQLTPAGTFKAWNFNGVDGTGLEPFTSKTLAATETFTLEDLEGKLGISLDGKQVYGYIGYMSDVSKLNYSTAVIFNVATLPSDTCPVGIGSLPPIDSGNKRLCVLSGTQLSNHIHLTNNFEYILGGAVFIGGDNTASSTLTIDAGVKIYGESGADFLVIRRGSKIEVNGSPDMPVIMTSANDSEATSSTRGQWGGLIINGNAPINGCSVGTALCESEGEGNTGLYGGNNPADNSGNLNYLQLKYAGYEITPDNELNGIAFQAVGSGTLVDYVQVHNNSDDGVEFFGGTVNAKHLYLSGIGDDSVDWTMGYSGKLQHVVVVQTDRGDQGIEADSNQSNRDSLPRSMPKIANLTMIGNINTDQGILLREGTGANIYNAVVTGFGDDCLDIDHSATFINAGSSATSLTGNLTITNTVLNCTVKFREESGDSFSVETWFNNQSGNSTTAVNMTTYTNNNEVNALTPATLTDSFFDATDYVGAVKNTASDWTAGWTYKD